MNLVLSSSPFEFFSRTKFLTKDLLQILFIFFARKKKKDGDELMFTKVNGQFTNYTINGVLGIVGGSSSMNRFYEKIRYPSFRSKLKKRST